MNIVVILRAVRDPASFTVNRKAQKIFIHREQFICNPSDRNALEAALALKDSQVTAVSYGGAPADDLLRLARALGASRSVLLGEASLQNAEAGAVTRALLTALSGLGTVDLVLMGHEVLDADLAQVGPRLAQALGWPFVEGAWQVEAFEEAGVRAIVSAGRALAAGRAVEADLPAVVSMRRDSNRPRYAAAGPVINAYSQAEAVEVIPADRLGLGGEAARVLFGGKAFPPERSLGEVLDGARPETLQTLAAVLRQEG